MRKGKKSSVASKFVSNHRLSTPSTLCVQVPQVEILRTCPNMIIYVERDVKTLNFDFSRIKDHIQIRTLPTLLVASIRGKNVLQDLQKLTTNI